MGMLAHDVKAHPMVQSVLCTGTGRNVGVPQAVPLHPPLAIFSSLAAQRMAMQSRSWQGRRQQGVLGPAYNQEHRALARRSSIADCGAEQLKGTAQMAGQGRRSEQNQQERERTTYLYDFDKVSLKKLTSPFWFLCLRKRDLRGG